LTECDHRAPFVSWSVFFDAKGYARERSTVSIRDTSAAAAVASRPVIGDLWYRNAVLYSLDVETFMDASGDGIGDLEGLTRRLDYLETLGVDALWLAPFQPSPRRDDGYDVTDHYGVDPRFGSSGEFVELVREAGSRGMRVLIDLVVNHTSDRHPWFLAAREPGSQMHDWYVWSKRRPANWRSGVVFPGVQRSTWSFDKRAREYYFHRFYEFQPDLNMDNPCVREEVQRIMGFWLQLGVPGFRVDAVPFVLEKPPRGRGRQQLHFEYLKEFRDLLQWRVGNAVLLGEANVLPQESQEYFAGGDGLHMMFNFWVNQHLFLALASGNARPLAAALRATRKLPESAQWAHFLRNHDELDLGRLAAADRRLVLDSFAKDPSARLYGRGIRRRPASMLGDRRRLELAYSLVLSLPGTPVLRYGDEIGMGENLRLKERAAIRTPMQWSAERHGGFSTADTIVRPAVEGGPYGFETVNVEAQRRDPYSLLQWTTRMIRLRKLCPEIGWGEWSIVAGGSSAVLALAYRWRDETVVCAHNVAEEPVEAVLRLGGGRLVDLIEDDEIDARPGAAHRVPLEAYGYRWFRLRQQ
jgi:maltose alpha-D-glucosyltransferase/alpha-amylase